MLLLQARFNGTGADDQGSAAGLGLKPGLLLLPPVLLPSDAASAIQRNRRFSKIFTVAP
jgi:hypothetical protein